MEWLMWILFVVVAWFVGHLWWIIFNFLDDTLESYIYDKLEYSFVRRSLQNIRRFVVIIWASIPIGTLLYGISKMGD